MSRIKFFLNLIFASTFLLSYVLNEKVDAEGQSCFVMAVEGGGRVFRAGGDAGSALEAGDILDTGDRVQVPAGSSVNVAFDKPGLNILHLVGPASVLISELEPARVELGQGEVYAIIDDRLSLKRFELWMPTAAAVVRGTRFRASYVRGMAEFSCSAGYIRVSGRDREGERTPESVLLGPGQRTEVRYRGNVPEPPEPWGEREKGLFHAVVEKIETARGPAVESS